MIRLKSFAAILVLLPCMTHAGKAAETSESLTGQWLVTEDLHGTPVYARLDIEQKGQKITGQLDGDKLEGSLTGSAIHFIAKDESGGIEQVDGVLKNGVLSGTIIETDEADESHSDRYSFTAISVRRSQRAAPVHHEFSPSVFYREFSASNKPVLSVAAGDSIHTTTVDAGGTDQDGHVRILGGNPQTGPFYIRSAVPGDTLVVHLVRLRLNRDYAVSDDGIVSRGLDSRLAVKMDDAFRTATANMAAWLAEDYQLTPAEMAEVFGTAAEYRVSEVADRNAGVVLKINKDRLEGAAQAKPADSGSPR
jgi:amidase